MCRRTVITISSLGAELTEAAIRGAIEVTEVVGVDLVLTQMIEIERTPKKRKMMAMGRERKVIYDNMA